MDYALLVLYAEKDSPELCQFFVSQPEISLEDGINILDRMNASEHPKALLYRSHGMYSQALNIWERLPHEF